VAELATRAFSASHEVFLNLLPSSSQTSKENIEYFGHLVVHLADHIDVHHHYALAPL
jgi:hypothetical protein